MADTEITWNEPAAFHPDSVNREYNGRSAGLGDPVSQFHFVVMSQSHNISEAQQPHLYMRRVINTM